MDLSLQLDKVLLESKEPETLAWIEIRSPLDLPSHKYRWRPPEIATAEGSPGISKHRKLISSEIRKKQIKNLTDKQEKELEKIKSKRGRTEYADLARRENVWSLTMPDFVEGACPKCGATEPHLKEKWLPEYDQKIKNLNKLLKDDKAKLENQKEELREILSQEDYSRTDRRRLEKEIGRTEQEIVGVPGSTVDHSFPGHEYNINMAWTDFRLEPLTVPELKMAVMHGYASPYLYSLMRIAKDPVIAQYSRNFDDMVAFIVYDLFLNDPSKLSMEHVIGRLSRSSTSLIQKISRDSRFINLTSMVDKNRSYLGHENKPQWNEDDKAWLEVSFNGIEFLMLLEHGYAIEEIRRALAEHYVEARKTSTNEEVKWERIKDDETITRSIGRILKDLKSFYEVDGEGDETKEITGLHSEDESVEDYSRRSEENPGKAHLYKGSTRNPEDSNMILDLPRNPDDHRETMTDIKERYENSRTVPDFAWLIITGFEKSAEFGVDYKPDLTDSSKLPKGRCTHCDPSYRIRTGNDKRTCPYCFGAGKLNAWYWSDMVGYEAHPESVTAGVDNLLNRSQKLKAFWSDRGWKGLGAGGGPGHSIYEENKELPRIPSPFERVLKIVWDSLSKNGYAIEAFDGVERGPKWETAGEKAGSPISMYDSGVPEPMYVEQPFGQDRALHSWNSPSYVVILKIKNLPTPAEGRFRNEKAMFRSGIGREFKKIAHNILEPSFKKNKFFLKPLVESDVSNYMVGIQAYATQVQHSETLGRGRHWDDVYQPSVSFIKDCFKLWSIAKYLDAADKHSPYLWKVLGKPEMIRSHIEKYIDDVGYQECLEESLKHLQYGMSFMEFRSLDTNLRHRLSHEQDVGIRREAKSELEKELASKSRSAAFIGQDKIISDLKEILKDAKTYDYTFDKDSPSRINRKRIPDRLNYFMTAMNTLQALYDSHIFGIRQKRDPEALKKSEEIGVPISHIEGGLLPRGKSSKRERLLTLARRIQRIVEYAGLNSTGVGRDDEATLVAPHHQIYLAMGRNYLVPGRIVKNNVRSGVYDIVDNKYSTMYSKYLLEKFDIKSSFESLPDSLSSAITASNSEIDLLTPEILEALYCAQSPNVAVVHLDAAISDLNHLDNMYGKQLEEISVVFYSKGRMMLGDKMNITPKGVSINNKTESRPKFILKKKLDDVGPTNAKAVLAQCWEELNLWVSEARRRLDNKAQQKLRVTHEKRAKDYIERGGRQAIVEQEQNWKLLTKFSEINAKIIMGGAVDQKERYEFSIFQMLRSLFWDAMSTHWLPEDGEYRSLREIDSGFGNYFKAKHPEYSKLDLSLKGLLDPGVEFDCVSPKKELRILSDMDSLLKRAIESAKSNPAELENIVFDIIEAGDEK